MRRSSLTVIFVLVGLLHLQAVLSFGASSAFRTAWASLDVPGNQKEPARIEYLDSPYDFVVNPYFLATSVTACPDRQSPQSDALNMNFPGINTTSGRPEFPDDRRTLSRQMPKIDPRLPALRLPGQESIESGDATAFGKSNAVTPSIPKTTWLLVSSIIGLIGLKRRKHLATTI
jgi:hypothetical protein